MTPLPISTITKVFHPRIVPIPNATITELRITELFYCGLLLPNVAHSNEMYPCKQSGPACGKYLYFLDTGWL